MENIWMRVADTIVVVSGYVHVGAGQRGRTVLREGNNNHGTCNLLTSVFMHPTRPPPHTPFGYSILFFF